MQPCILAKRLASWALRISPSQKGFLPFEGCAEHSFILRSTIKESKRRNKNDSMAGSEKCFRFRPARHNLGDAILLFIVICEQIYPVNSGCSWLHQSHPSLKRNKAGMPPQSPAVQHGSGGPPTGIGVGGVWL